MQEVATAVDPPADKTGEGSQEGKPEKIYGVLGDSGRATPVVLVRPGAKADTDADVSNVVIPKFLHSFRHETALSLAGWLTSAERPAGSSRYWVPRREKEHARTANGEVTSCGKKWRQHDARPTQSGFSCSTHTPVAKDALLHRRVRGRE